MELLKIKKNYQVTIPQSLRKQINLAEGDYVEAEVENGNLVIRPVALRRISKQDKEAAVGALDGLWREMGKVDAEEIQELVNEAIGETRKRDWSKK
jgi:AbrB family looped-hinge helix DNA binding protein